MLATRTTSSPSSGTTSTSPGSRAARRRRGPRRPHGGGPAGQRRGRHPLPGRVAGRQRRGRHPRPHGGRRHRRDQPLPGLAVGAHRGVAGTPARTVTARAGARVIDEGEVAGIGELDRLDDARRLFEQVALAEDFPTSSPCPPTRSSTEGVAVVRNRSWRARRALEPVDAARAGAYPGEAPTRQPVHTCYVPADAVVPGWWWLGRAGAGRPRRARPADLGFPGSWSTRCCRGCARSSPTSRSRTCGSTARTATGPARPRGRRRRPGRGGARRGAGVAAVLGHPRKSLEGPTAGAGVRSLDLFLGGLAGRGRAGGHAAQGHRGEQVAAFLPVLDALEQAHGLALDLELQVETRRRCSAPTARRRWPRCCTPGAAG